MTNSAWRLKNHEHELKQQAIYRENHREQMQMYARKSRQENPQHFLLQAAKARLVAYAVLGGACAMCGNSNPMVLEFDHINNDGVQHRSNSSMRGGGLLSWIKNNPDAARSRLQLLCSNCHSMKHSLFNGLEGYQEII